MLIAAILIILSSIQAPSDWNISSLCLFLSSLAIETDTGIWLVESPVAENNIVYPETNLLASYVLDKVCGMKELAQKLRASIGKTSFFSPYEILISCNSGEWRKPSWRLSARPLTLREMDGIKIASHIVVGSLPDWSHYADRLALYVVMLSCKGDYIDAFRALNNLTLMFDGIGFRDKAFSAAGLYDTYKLALCSIAAKCAGDKYYEEKCTRLLVSVKPPASRYDENLRGIGDLNVETASLALLALNGEMSLCNNRRINTIMPNIKAEYIMLMALAVMLITVTITYAGKRLKHSSP